MNIVTEFYAIIDTLPTLSQYTRFSTSSPRPNSDKTLHIPVPIPSLDEEITLPIFSGYAYENADSWANLPRV